MVRKKAPGFGNTMAAYILLMVTSFSATKIYAQTITQKLQKAFLIFEADEQLSHAISSLYVIDAKSGKVVYDKNSGAGLAPASTQKVITHKTIPNTNAMGISKTIKNKLKKSS